MDMLERKQEQNKGHFKNLNFDYVYSSNKQICSRESLICNKNSSFYIHHQWAAKS